VGEANSLGLKDPAVKRYILGEIGPAVAKSNQSKEYLVWYLQAKVLKSFNFFLDIHHFLIILMDRGDKP